MLRLHQRAGRKRIRPAPAQRARHGRLDRRDLPDHAAHRRRALRPRLGRGTRLHARRLDLHPSRPAGAVPGLLHFARFLVPGRGALRGAARGTLVPALLGFPGARRDEQGAAWRALAARHVLLLALFFPALAAVAEAAAQLARDRFSSRSSPCRGTPTWRRSFPVFSAPISSTSRWARRSTRAIRPMRSSFRSSSSTRSTCSSGCRGRCCCRARSGRWRAAPRGTRSRGLGVDRAGKRRRSDLLGCSRSLVLVSVRSPRGRITTA